MLAGPALLTETLVLVDVIDARAVHARFDSHSSISAAVNAIHVMRHVTHLVTLTDLT